VAEVMSDRPTLRPVAHAISKAFLQNTNRYLLHLFPHRDLKEYKENLAVAYFKSYIETDGRKMNPLLESTLGKLHIKLCVLRSCQILLTERETSLRIR
jgi:hypothetical protein